MMGPELYWGGFVGIVLGLFYVFLVILVILLPIFVWRIYVHTKQITRLLSRLVELCASGEAIRAPSRGNPGT